MVFSPKQSQKRIDRALKVLPAKVLKRILSFSLFLLGAKRKAIASLMEMPEETVKTGISKVMKEGFSSIRDRRQHENKCDPQPSNPREEAKATVLVEEKF